MRFRFRIGTDRDVGTLPGGWYVDDIRLYTCVNSVPMFSAVLPAGRSVQVGSTATAFVTIINAGTEVANNVSIGLTTVVPGSFVYQTADSSNNPTGTQNTPATIQPGTAQNFIIAFTPSAAFAPTNVALNMSGTNALPVTPVTGLNTLLVSSTSGPGPDIIALAATITPRLIVDIPGPDGIAAFAVATSNVRAAGNIAVTANKGNLPIVVTVCQTGGDGACLTDTGSQRHGGHRRWPDPDVFSFFVAGQDNVPFDPANNRIFPTFTDTATGYVVGGTSVAVRTQ